MKRLLYSLVLIVVFPFLTKAQTTVFSENFDGGTVQFNSVGSPGWATDNALFLSSPNSWRGQYLPNGTVSTETNSFNTTGNQFVTLNFSQICKVDFVDVAKIEISTDGGTTWTQLIASVGGNCFYNGPGNYVAQGNKFTEASYLDWDPAAATFPLNTWWKQESFDISQLAGNQADVRLRFSIVDNFGNGMNLRAGWFLEDIGVVMAPCEQTPPTIALDQPIWIGNIYTLQPTYDVFAELTDLSGISQNFGDNDLFWTINSDPTVYQAFGMINIANDQWAGTIYNPNGLFVQGDTVCYWIQAVDASGCNNTTLFPATGCIQFIINDGIKFPFCDAFDNGGPYWTPDSNSVGTNWAIGPPGQTVLSTPLSAPNVMGLDLTTSYQNNTISSINLITLSFIGYSNANLTFWHNSDMESCCDGVNLQYSNDNGLTWNVIGTLNDPNGTNWYNSGSVSSSNSQPVWTANSGGWIESRYKLGTIPGIMGQGAVIFRFNFTSDFSVVGDGFDVDDFCIKIPCDDDLGVNAFVAPAPNTGLPAGANFPITVTIENYGNVAQTSANINYSVNNGTPVTFAWTGSIPAGGVTNIVLPTSFVVPASGSFDVCTWVELPNDCDQTNDTVCATFTAVPTLIPTYCDDFEAANIGWTIGNLAGSGAGTIWELGAPGFGQTNSSNSGANAWDINLTSGYTNNAEAYLYSPFFDFSAISAGRISFSLNWNFDQFSNDGGYLQYTTDGGATWNTLGSGSTTNPDPCGTNWYTTDNLNFNNQPAWDVTSSTIPGNVNGWISCNYGLCCSNNVFNNPLPVQFRFVFISDGFGTLDGISMDDFCVTASNGDNIGVTAIVTPVGSVPAGTPTNVTVTVTNSGSSTITAFDVNYSINSVAGLTPISWTGSLAPCASIDITFTGVIFPGGSSTLCGYTILGTDVDPANDTLCAPMVGIPLLSLTYCDDFENGNIGWAPTLNPGGDPGTIWELGTPTFAPTNSANSGANAWDINLNTTYTANADAVLTSPFLDFSSVSAGRLTFAINYSVEGTFDGVRLEYKSGTNPWQLVGSGSSANPDPCGTNWYTNAGIVSSGLNAWDGNSGGWLTCSYKLCCTTGIFNAPDPVQFRFVFTSDGSVQPAGFSIDDFCVLASTGDDVGISAITSPVGGVPAGTSVPVVVTLTNFGSSTITSTVINYSVNNVLQSGITWNGTLLPCQEVSVTLPGFIAISGVNAICAWTELTGDVNNANDTTCADLIGQPVITPTYITSYTDNFEFGNIGWAPSVAAGANAGSVWELGYPNFGNTTGAHSPSTGNAWDVNLITAVTTNANAILTTPYFDLTNANQCILRFWMNRAMGTFSDQMYMEYSDDGVNWTKLGSSTTPNATNWYNNVGNDIWDGNSGSWLFTELPDVNSLMVNPNPALVQFRFVFRSTGFSTPDGASIDDFELFVPVPTTVTPVTVNTSNPNTLIIPAQAINFAAPIKNNGLNTIFNHNATLRIDGVVISTDPISYSSPFLEPDSTLIHNFANTWVATPGYHEICVYTDSPNGSADLKPTDDTTCITVLVFDTIPYTGFPYCNSFEGGTQWVTLNALTYQSKSTWQQGPPTQPFLGTAHTGNNAWSVILDSNYVNTDSSGLFSSIFRVQANHCYHLTFWQQFRMEFGSDGGAVDYSMDYGANWDRIDFTGTPNIVNWGPNTNYTYVSALDPNDPSQNGFTGIRNNWFLIDKTFRPGVDGQMIIRWRFASDFSGRDEGWSIDDVCLEDLGPCTPLGVNDYAIGEFGLSQNYPNPSVDATSFEYMIPKFGAVKIVVNDIVGKLITTLVDGEQTTGKHLVDVNTKNFAPGVYTYTLTYGDQQVTKRMVITK